MVEGCHSREELCLGSLHIFYQHLIVMQMWSIFLELLWEKKVSNLIRVLECSLLVVYRISQITVPFILFFFFLNCAIELHD